MQRSLDWSIPALISCALLASCGPSRPPAGELPTPGGSLTSTELKAVVLQAEDRRQVTPALLEALHNAAPEIRVIAVRALGRIGDRAFRDRIVAALEDENGQVRSTAAFALALVGDTKIDAALAALRADPDPRARAGLADALRLIADPSAEALLLELIEDKDLSVAAKACQAAPAFEGTAVVERLMGQVESVHPERRVAAAYALARLSAETGRLTYSVQKRARELLMRLADDSIGEMRRLAAMGLAIPTGDAQARVLGRLTKDRDVAVRIEAVRSFSFPGAPIEPFLDKTLVDSDDRVVLATVLGLGRMRSEEAANALARLVVDDERDWLRTAAVLAMPKTDPIRAAGMANGLTRESSFPLRRASTQLVLEPYGDQRTENVMRLWNDEDPVVRTAVLPALAWAAESLKETVGKLVEDDARLTRIALARTAERMLASDDEARRAEAVSVLERLWSLESDRGDARVQMRILDAAAAGGATDALRALLERGLDATDFGVRRRAAQHLRKGFPGERWVAEPPTKPGFQHYVEIARWAELPRAAIVTVKRPGFLPGRFTVALDAVNAPLHAWNFAQLAQTGAFDGLELESIPNVTLRPGNGVEEGYGDVGPAIRAELGPGPFWPGTLVSAAGPAEQATGGWWITLSMRPEWSGQRTAFGQVIQNFPGVVGQVLPQDRIVSVKVYQGDGSEPLPPLQ